MSMYFKDPDGHSIEFISDDTSDPSFGVRPFSEWKAKA